eukprot:CCRYP_017835-RB/>CCRYP_017835-RB protein AED:0.01 eAED:0.01 QI:409/1/0.88/1/0.37/0.33/9/7259/738
MQRAFHRHYSLTCHRNSASWSHYLNFHFPSRQFSKGRKGRYHSFTSCSILSGALSLPPFNNHSIRCPLIPRHYFIANRHRMSSTKDNQSAPAVAATTSSTHQLITEGSITMLYPKSENSVFYNPVQIQNRDLSILMIGMYAQRRVEKQWEQRKRKEVRRELTEGGANNGGAGEKMTKEERKERNARLEKEIEERVQKEKASVDFVKLTKESARGDSSQNNDEASITGLTILDALAASGLRSLRYWKEIPGVRTVVVNDLDPVAIELAKENVIRNGLVDDLANDPEHNTSNINDVDRPFHRPRGIILQVGDATHEMYTSRLPPTLYPSQQSTTQRLQKPQYDVIDLDPYGSASPFVDAAIQSVVSGGMLAVTCTDMAALGGSHPETCYGRYASFPVQRAGYLQEMAVRILLYQLSVVAGRYGRSIRPVLSVGMAFYCRVFVEVYDDKAGVNNLSLMHGHLFQSTQCSSFHVTPIGTNELVSHQLDPEKHPNPSNKKLSNVYKNGRGPCDLGEPVCSETGASYKVGGPFWIGPLHDFDVVNDAITRLEAAQNNKGVDPSGASPVFPLHTSTTLHGLLVSVSEELPDVPLYHTLTALCSAVNSCTIPMLSFRAALVNAGYRVSAYHKEPQAVKTDAPNHVVWDVVRAWCKDHPPNKRKESKRHKKGDEPGSNAPPNQPQFDIATKILAKEMKTAVDFTIPKGFGEKRKARRYAVNPEAHWGPKKAASWRNKRKMDDVHEAD